MYLSRNDKDTLITYLQAAGECDAYREGYEAGFQQAINIMCDLINTFEGWPEALKKIRKKSVHQIPEWCSSEKNAPPGEGGALL